MINKWKSVHSSKGPGKGSFFIHKGTKHLSQSLWLRFSVDLSFLQHAAFTATIMPSGARPINTTVGRTLACGWPGFIPGILYGPLSFKSCQDWFLSTVGCGTKEPQQLYLKVLARISSGGVGGMGRGVSSPTPLCRLNPELHTCGLKSLIAASSELLVMF